MSMIYDRIPLCALQSKLDRIEREIDAEIKQCAPLVQLRWRTLRSPQAERDLVGVNYFLRTEFDHLSRIVVQRQLAEYRRIMEETELSVSRYIVDLIAAWARLEGLL